MSAAARWVRERLADAPPALLDAMLDALPAGPDGEEDVAGALAEGAATLYARVLESGDGRDAALPLLAADALMTHALQARAERDVASLADFAAAWGAGGRLGALAAEAR